MSIDRDKFIIDKVKFEFDLSENNIRLNRENIYFKKFNKVFNYISIVSLQDNRVHVNIHKDIDNNYQLSQSKNISYNSNNISFIRPIKNLIKKCNSDNHIPVIYSYESNCDKIIKNNDIFTYHYKKSFENNGNKIEANFAIDFDKDNICASYDSELFETDKLNNIHSIHFIEYNSMIDYLIDEDTIEYFNFLSNYSYNNKIEFNDILDSSYSLGDYIYNQIIDYKDDTYIDKNNKRYYPVKINLLNPDEDISDRWFYIDIEEKVNNTQSISILFYENPETSN